MSLAQLSSADLNQLLTLVTERDRIRSQIEKINTAIDSIGNGHASRPVGKKVGRARGTLGEKIIAALKNAGAPGLSIDDLVTQTRGKKGSISVWLYTQAKKVRGIRKLGRGTFGWKA